MSGAKQAEEIFSWIILEGAHNAITTKVANDNIYFRFRALEDSELNLDFIFWSFFFIEDDFY
jgi:hypothetical protein